MRIKLKSIDIKNFKGIKSFKENFSDEVFIHGANASGKTTIFDAEMWVLFGKDSAGLKDFEIKPLDENNKTTAKLDNVVELTLDIDNIELKLKRTHKEKWVKKRGSIEVMFSGNETVYHINGVPKSQADFNKKVGSLVDEELFKLITSPQHFNSLHWKKRRELVIALVGEINTDSFMNETVREILNKDQDIDDARKEFAALMKNLKDELKFIPSRIDEVYKGRPEELDWADINTRLTSKKKDLAEINEMIMDKSKVIIQFRESISDERIKLQELKHRLDNYKYNFDQNNQDLNQTYNSENREKERAIKSVEENIRNLKDSIKMMELRIKDFSVEKDTLLKSWYKNNDKQYSRSDKCPVCEQKLPEGPINVLKEAFRNNKAKDLKNIEMDGKRLANSIEDIEEIIIESKNELSLELANLKKLKLDIITPPTYTVLKDSKKYIELSKAYNDAKEKLDAKKEPRTETLELEGNKQAITAAIVILELKANVKHDIDRSNARIKELKGEERKLAQELADLENRDNEVMMYLKSKITALETKINSLFKGVSFKMFETQINGGEKEICETLVGGVPYGSNLNSAAKINAGLAIINTFSKFYNTFAPIFVDDRNLVTELVETDTQIINLLVDPKHKLPVLK